MPTSKRDILEKTKMFHMEQSAKTKNPLKTEISGFLHFRPLFSFSKKYHKKTK
tara:strand:- start:2124 stop:2282 length:159 start_codon:yes stop_codon:yes gene_type:complete